VTITRLMYLAWRTKYWNNFCNYPVDESGQRFGRAKRNIGKVVGH
jgi:hypothetical protein